MAMIEKEMTTNTCEWGCETAEVAADPTREGQTEVSCLKKVPEFHLRFQNFFCTALGQKNYPGSVVKPGLQVYSKR
jgi:hypothetical protein